MKSKDWAKRFESEDLVQVVGDFALETRELVEARTKFSTKEDKGKAKPSLQPAIDGALREQRQKWQAVCNLVPALAGTTFDKILAEHLNDLKTANDNWKNQGVKEKEESKTPQNGRSLVKD